MMAKIMMTKTAMTVIELILIIMTIMPRMIMINIDD